MTNLRNHAPVDLELEQAYLANAAARPGYLSENPVDSSWFFTRAHQRLVGVLIEQDAAGETPSLTDAVMTLRERGQLDNGISTAASEALNAPVTAGDLVAPLRRYAMRRAAIVALERATVELASEGADPDGLLAELEATLQGVAEQPGSEQATHTVQALLKGAMKRALERRDTPNTVEFPTGHYALDAATGGWRRGSVAIVGAASHWGKSSYALMVAELNLARGKRVLIVSAEDPAELWADRWLQLRARVPRWNADTGNLTAEQISSMTTAVTNAEAEPVFLDVIGRSVDWACREMRRIIRRDRIDLVFVDYLGAFVTNRTPGDDQRLRLNHVGRSLTSIIKRECVAGVFFSQITPSKDGQVSMYSLRDSKDLAIGAEVVLLGEVLSSSIDRPHNERVRTLKVAKNKPGPAPAGGTFEMGSEPRLQAFLEVREPGADFHDEFSADGSR